MSTFHTPGPTDPDDAHQWLEDVEGERSLAWVRQRNAVSQAELEAEPGFAALTARLRAIFDSDDRIPHVVQRDGLLYNYWTDADHPRGLWRRTTPTSYRTDAPEWEILLDVDALGAEEGVNWVWHGATCRRPAYDRCMVALSRGGSDADEKREFDLATGSFVADGFVLPEAKSSVAWRDRDRLYVMTDTGEGSLTASGYPRTARLWSRGTPLADAPVVFAGEVDDIAAGVYRTTTPGFERTFAYRQLTFFTNTLAELTDDGVLLAIPKPDDVKAVVHRDHVYFEPRHPWTHLGRTHAAGALLRAPYPAWREATDVPLEELFVPDEHSSLEDWGFTANHLYLNVLRDVRSEVTVLTATADGWRREPLPGVPAMGTLEVRPVDPDASDAVFVLATDFLTPSTLSWAVLGEGPPEVLKRVPHQFDASGLRVGQHFATSADGTRVPYFQIGRADAPADGSTPTILYGYGGFEVSLKPAYTGHIGAGWLDRGGTYVIANIRGGGEYGPRWHQAALKANRHRAYEDFAAVARDLFDRGVASPTTLGTMGGSNGGLLMGNMYTRYPELFGAVVCQVPLLDMRRYTKLLAGASWAGEYGDPDDPEQWAYIQTFSPYHQIEPDRSAPPILFTTSTRDDRVHPGHARKMAAALLALDRRVLYYENLEGGHGGAADNAQAAYMRALAFAFLWRELSAG
jgi:prolyl oligopeptidase